jgi:polysaccharide biosynthesis/export protein
MTPKSKKSRYNFQRLLPLFVIMISLGISSCVSQRDLEYMRKDNKTPAVYNVPAYSDYKLQSNDALYIQVNSVDAATSNVFAQSSAQQGGIDQYGAYLTSYTIDQSGYVQLPVIGKIKALGKTTTEVSELIKDSVQNILSMPTITVKLVNQYVSVLGEVHTPGHYVFAQDKLTIFNALGLAGDITEYGDRKHVTLVRYENGKNVRYIFDLTDPNVLASTVYYVQPNDLIYVKPIKKRIWGMQEFPASLILSIITTALVVVTFIQQN